MAGYFLDTSALAKLYHQEAGSEFVERLVEQPSCSPIISRLSLIEIESVLAIKGRTGEMDAGGQDLFRRRLRADLSQDRIRIAPPIGETAYRRARSLIVRFGQAKGLRTLDALQLAVALLLKEDGLVSTLVAADRRLCSVAEECGCATLDPSDPAAAIPRSP